MNYKGSISSESWYVLVINIAFDNSTKFLKHFDVKLVADSDAIQCITILFHLVFDSLMFPELLTSSYWKGIEK